MNRLLRRSVVLRSLSPSSKIAQQQHNNPHPKQSPFLSLRTSQCSDSRVRSASRESEFVSCSERCPMICRQIVSFSRSPRPQISAISFQLYRRLSSLCNHHRHQAGLTRYLLRVLAKCTSVVAIRLNRRWTSLGADMALS